MSRNKADLYKLSRPHRLPKPREYDPERELTADERQMVRAMVWADDMPERVAQQLVRDLRD